MENENAKERWFIKVILRNIAGSGLFRWKELIQKASLLKFSGRESWIFFCRNTYIKSHQFYLYVYFGRYWARKNRNKGDILSTPLGPPPVFHFAPESLALFALAFRPKEKIVYNWESISNWLLVSLATIHTSYSTPWKCSLLSFGSNAEDQLGNSSLNDLHIFKLTLFEGQSYHSLPPGTFNSRLIVHFSISNSPK